MHDRIDRVTRVVTSVSLVAAALLLAPGFAGLSPSASLAGGVFVLALVAFVFRDQLVPYFDYPWLEPHVDSAWVGPLVAAFLLVSFRGATPGELQTVGAVVGLIGMFNYLLRPIYFVITDVAVRISRLT